MTGRRLLLALSALLIVAAASIGGYLLGTAGAAGDADAMHAAREASGEAYAAAQAEAMAEAIERGRLAGLSAGERQGQKAGRKFGSLAGRAEAREEAGPVLVASSTARKPGSDTEAEAEAEVVPTTPPGDFDGGGEVLVVGDSLQELSSPYLQQYLPKVDLTINAVGGYNSYQIFDLFQESFDPSQSVIVFDGGTNDNPNYPEILAGNLEAVSKIVGDRCMVVPTIHGLSVDGVGDDGKNQVVQSFAASRPGTQTPDWAGAVSTHPELMQADNLHPIAEGADLRSQLIAEGIRACLEGGVSF